MGNKIQFAPIIMISSPIKYWTKLFLVTRLKMLVLIKKVIRDLTILGFLVLVKFFSFF
jgi:hypothetical protein